MSAAGVSVRALDPGRIRASTGARMGRASGVILPATVFVNEDGNAQTPGCWAPRLKTL